MLDFLHTIIYVPLYNGLIFFVDKAPWHDVGIAVILITIVVRVVLYPLSKRAVESQLAMKKVAPEVEALKQKHKSDPVEQNKAILALYKERGIRPFAGIVLLLLQLPVLISLYYMFVHGGLPEVRGELLYSFVSAPETVNMQFLGFVDMAAVHNLPLALLVALSQFVYSRLSMGAKAKHESAVEATLSSDLAKSFDFQARYVMPVIIGGVGYFFPAVASLYLLTANIFMIGQEFLSGRRF